MNQITIPDAVERFDIPYPTLWGLAPELGEKVGTGWLLDEEKVRAFAEKREAKTRAITRRAYLSEKARIRRMPHGTIECRGCDLTYDLLWNLTHAARLYKWARQEWKAMSGGLFLPETRNDFDILWSQSVVGIGRHP